LSFPAAVSSSWQVERRHDLDGRLRSRRNPRLAGRRNAGRSPGEAETERSPNGGVDCDPGVRPADVHGAVDASGAMVGFIFFAGLGIASMYAYYATVYSAIQDVIEPALRGTAMALYFFAMYVLGASLGPVGMGFLSSYFTRSAARAAGVTEVSF